MIRSSRRFLAHAMACCAALGLAATLLTPREARADVMTFTAVGSGGRDNGIDGTFDLLTPNEFVTGVVDVIFVELLYRFALEFDISALPGGATVNSATLYLRVANGTIGPTTLAGYLGDGTITLADMTAGADVVSFTPADFSLHGYDVTAFIQGMYGSGDWAGFSARQNPLGTTSAFWDGPQDSEYPRLSIDYTVRSSSIPEPASLALLGLGLAGLAAVRRRRK